MEVSKGRKYSDTTFTEIELFDVIKIFHEDESVSLLALS
ncbi:MAG: hypothetical protein QOE47_2377 [Pyrinomonadaceae bacterium]|jgi:hypothetical protein|nr:hypothetical protein [Pyrinomonadaceae bacterium]